jgi:hypothetical protein
LYRSRSKARSVGTAVALSLLGLAAISVLATIPPVSATSPSSCPTLSFNQSYGATSCVHVATALPASNYFIDGTDGDLLATSSGSQSDSYGVANGDAYGSANFHSIDEEASVTCPSSLGCSSLANGREYDTYSITCPITICTPGQTVNMILTYDISFTGTACDEEGTATTGYFAIGTGPTPLDAHNSYLSTPIGVHQFGGVGGLPNSGSYYSGTQQISMTGKVGGTFSVYLEAQAFVYCANGQTSTSGLSDPINVYSNDRGVTVTSAADQQCVTNPTTSGCPPTSTGVPEFPLGTLSLLLIALPLLFVLRQKALKLPKA